MAIVDYKLVAEAMGRLIRSSGGGTEFGINVDGIQESLDQVLISSGGREWAAKQLITCAGLQPDRLAQLAGVKVEHRIVPFRGEYYRLRAGKNDIVRHLIYPIPDPGALSRHSPYAHDRRRHEWDPTRWSAPPARVTTSFR